MPLRKKTPKELQSKSASTAQRGVEAQLARAKASQMPEKTRTTKVATTKSQARSCEYCHQPLDAWGKCQNKDCPAKWRQRAGKSPGAPATYDEATTPEVEIPGSFFADKKPRRVSWGRQGPVIIGYGTIGVGRGGKYREVEKLTTHRPVPGSDEARGIQQWQALQGRVTSAVHSGKQSKAFCHKCNTHHQALNKDGTPNKTFQQHMQHMEIRGTKRATALPPHTLVRDEIPEDPVKAYKEAYAEAEAEAPFHWNPDQVDEHAHAHATAVSGLEFYEERRNPLTRKVEKIPQLPKNVRSYQVEYEKLVQEAKRWKDPKLTTKYGYPEGVLLKTGDSRLDALIHAGVRYHDFATDIDWLLENRHKTPGYRTVGQAARHGLPPGLTPPPPPKPKPAYRPGSVTIRYGEIADALTMKGKIPDEVLEQISARDWAGLRAIQKRGVGAVRITWTKDKQVRKHIQPKGTSKWVLITEADYVEYKPAVIPTSPQQRESYEHRRKWGSIAEAERKHKYAEERGVKTPSPVLDVDPEAESGRVPVLPSKTCPSCHQRKAKTQFGKNGQAKYCDDCRSMGAIVVPGGVQTKRVRERQQKEREAKELRQRMGRDPVTIRRFLESKNVRIPPGAGLAEMKTALDAVIAGRPVVWPHAPVPPVVRDAQAHTEALRKHVGVACPMCKQEFFSQQHLQQHINSRHPRSKLANPEAVKAIKAALKPKKVAKKK